MPKMSFACKILVYREEKLEYLTVHSVIRNEHGQQEASEGVETAKFVWRILGLSFFYNDPCGGEGKYTVAVPALVPVLRGGRSCCRDAVALCRLCAIHRI